MVARWLAGIIFLIGRFSARLSKVHCGAISKISGFLVFEFTGEARSGKFVTLYLRVVESSAHQSLLPGIDNFFGRDFVQTLLSKYHWQTRTGNWDERESPTSYLVGALKNR
jgi:hypothetical protein